MNIKSKILETPRLRLSAQLVAGLSLIHLSQVEKAFPWLALPFLALVAYSVLLDHELLEKPLYWLMLALLYTFNLAADWYQPSNHHFVFFYLFIALALTFKNRAEDRDSIFQSNAKWILVSVLFFAALQKALSPEYMDGSFFAYLISTGSFFKIFYYFTDQAQIICRENHSALISFVQTDPNLNTSLQIKKPIENLAQISFILSYKVLLVEALIPIAWLLIRSEAFKHLMLIGFVIGTFTCVPECGFLSMILTLGFAQCPEKYKRIRAAYLAIICIFIALILLKIGRP